MNFGENLKRIRKSRGLTQAELAEKIGVTQACIGKYETGKRVSCDRTTIVKYENGENASALERLFAIAEALDCTVSELLGEEPKVIYKDYPSVGRWEVYQLKELGEAWTVQCSVCKAIGFHGKTPFCPECGARME